MALTISQIVASSFPAVVAEARKPANQWAENGFLREFERQGGIKHKSLGPTIEVPVDYRVNPGAEFLVTDMTPVSLTKTDVISAASFAVAELSVPVTWSKKDEVMNPSENQKIAFVKGLLANGLDSHDDRIEYALFQASAVNGFGTIVAYFPTSGQGTVGGIDSGTETWHRHPSNTYVDDTDIEAGMTATWNSAAKASGGASPTLIVSDAATQAIFEGTQQANQRYVDSDELKAGFKVLGFKNARYVFSQYGTSSQFFLNPKGGVQLVVSKEMYRDKGETQEVQNANAFTFKIYSALQLVTIAKSRNGINHV